VSLIKTSPIARSGFGPESGRGYRPPEPPAPETMKGAFEATGIGWTAVSKLN
jgi:hypothetical protein